MWSDAGRRSLLKVGGCTILCTVQWLWRGACSTAGAAGDHVVSPFAAICRAPAFVLQREARTHASGESSYLELLSKAFFGSSRCPRDSNTGRHSGQISQGPPIIGRRYNCMDEGWH